MSFCWLKHQQVESLVTSSYQVERLKFLKIEPSDKSDNNSSIDRSSENGFNEGDLTESRSDKLKSSTAGLLVYSGDEEVLRMKNRWDKKQGKVAQQGNERAIVVPSPPPQYHQYLTRACPLAPTNKAYHLHILLIIVYWLSLLSNRPHFNSDEINKQNKENRHSKNLCEVFPR